MPTVSKTFVFLADAEDWNGSWIFDDGDPAAGCIEATRGGGAAFRWDLSGPVAPCLWDDWGIPHADIVHKVRVKCNWKVKDAFGDGLPHDYRIRFQVHDNTTTYEVFAQTVTLTIAAGDFSTWQEITTLQELSGLCIKYHDAFGTPNNQLAIGPTLFQTPPITGTTTARIDTVVLEWEYDAPSLSVTPSTADIVVNTSVNLTANTAVTWSISSGGGSLINVASTTVTYVAPSSPGSAVVTATVGPGDCEVFNVPIAIESAPPCINFQATVAREGCGSDESCNAYGGITNLTECSPIAAGTYCITVPVVDLNGAQPGDNIRVRVRRLWSDPLNTSLDPASIKKFQIEYDVQ